MNQTYFLLAISDNEGSAVELIGLFVDMGWNEVMMAAFLDFATRVLTFFRGKCKYWIARQSLDKEGVYRSRMRMLDFETSLDLVETLMVEIDVSEAFKMYQQFNNSVKWHFLI